MNGSCAFTRRGLPCYWFECTDCGWFSHSADLPWSRRDAEVHSTVLRPGHHVTQTDGHT